MNTVTFLNRISNNEVISQEGNVSMFMDSEKFQIEKFPIWVQSAINLIARCNEGKGMAPAELNKAYSAVCGYRNYMIKFWTGRENWDAMTAETNLQFGRSRSQWLDRVKKVDVKTGVSPQQMIWNIKKDIRASLAPILHNERTAAAMIDARLVTALEEETAALNEQYSRWDTRKDIGEAELCQVKHVVPNFAEVTNGPEYHAYEDEDASGGEWMSLVKSDDEDLSDGEQLGRTEFAAAFSERKEKVNELTETLRAGEIPRSKTLQRAKTLMDMKIIWAKDYWHLFRMAKVFSRVERERNLGLRTREIQSMNFA